MNDFMMAYPYLSITGFLILFMLISGAFESLVMRLTRMLQILVRGWPPEHVDADGEFADCYHDHDEEERVPATHSEGPK